MFVSYKLKKIYNKNAGHGIAAAVSDRKAIYAI